MKVSEKTEIATLKKSLVFLVVCNFDQTHNFVNVR